MTIQLKIQIRDIKKPPVWRRIVIPEDFSFHDLHDTIQAAFGWSGEHLYQFQRHPFDGGWTVKEPDEENDLWGNEPEYSHQTNVGAFIQHMGLKKFVYVYDFGDNWVHDITVENIEHEAVLDHPICLTGKGACPPEDCGGPGGYEELKKEMSKDEINEFDLEEVNDELEDYTAAGEGAAEEATDDTQDFLDIPDDAEELESLTLVDVLKRFYKGELVDYAEELGFDIDENLSEQEFREQYAKALIEHPVEVLRMLPLEDLMLLARLKEKPTIGNTAECFEDFRDKIIVKYGIAGQWWDADDSFHVWIPEDLWSALKPHIEAVLDDPHVQHRIEIENTILGLANLYGQVSLSFVYQELVRLGKAQTKEDAIAAVSACRDNSLWLKWAEHSIENFQDEPTDEGLLFLSPYGWSMPLELKHEIAMREELAKDYQLFPATDIMSAAVMPIPKIANPIHEAFVEMLTSDLELDNSQATVVCHELWYREMHKYEEVFEEEDPGAYFREEVLYDYDSYDGIFKKAMKMLDDYLNNMPHWQLKGHTPMEAQAIIDARRSITMPIISAKKPGRNDPCPCGSGKKYKNCCGRGN